MRIPFVSLFITSPFADLQEHAEKLRECAWAFQQAMECHMSDQCSTFENHKDKVDEIEREADAIKRRIRGHLPKGTLLAVDKFQLFRYLREQDSVLDSMKGALSWLSYRESPGIPPELKKDFAQLVDSAIDPIESLYDMLVEARKYFNTFSERQRVVVKEIISKLRQKEHDSDQVEHALKQRIFNIDSDPVTIFHALMLAEKIGDIADHVENAGDMMRAMVAR
jgi:hypothetical protein